MKRLTMLLALVAVVIGAQGQTLEEWFRQKETQEKYLLEQLAALRAYGEVAQRGYRIAQEGLDAIGLGNTGEHDLHVEFYRSLAEVSPTVRGYGKVAKILLLQEQLRQVSAHTRRQVQSNGVFSAAQALYIERVLHRIAVENDVTEELLALTMPERLLLQEAERLQRLDALYRQVQEAGLLARQFAQEVLLLATARTLEQRSLDREIILHGITGGER